MKIPKSIVLFTVCTLACAGWADTLELKNGSTIKGKYMGGDASSVTFQVGSSTQKYNVADIQTLTFDSTVKASTPAIYNNDTASGPMLLPRPTESTPAPVTRAVENTALKEPAIVTIPAGTELSIRMIDSIDSDTNRIGDRFQASVEEPVVVDGVTIIPKGADVYGRLSEAKEAGRVSGASELKLELVSLMVNGKSEPLVTGEYALKGAGRGSNTAKKAAGGAAIGAVIGAIAGGGKGAAIGAGVGAGAGTTVNAATKGEQVKVPSETILAFRLMQPLNLSRPAAR